MDVNRDGYVTRADFSEMARQSGTGYYGQVQAQQAFNNIDRNHDGIIDRYEQASSGLGGGYGYGPRYY